LLRGSYQLAGCFFNPNVQPRDEYFRRLQAAATVCRVQGISVWVPLYDPAPWFAAIQGNEADPEGGRRCEICFDHRLDAVARLAGLCSFDAFATTLTISPHKDARKINEIGERLASAYSVSYLASNFKKQHGFQTTLQKSKDMGLYRQHYCGCCFSLSNR
jgi:predicted adenine nucleotide alpha hydrolase (AANH) superfamily ATPase